MAKQKYHARINYDTDGNHPDAPNARGLMYEDVYTIDTDLFMGYDSPEEFIREDLALVAGGGYDTRHITNVKYTIRRA